MDVHGESGGGRRFFQMPLHYPRYSRKDYESMPENQLDMLLEQYGLPLEWRDLAAKRRFVMGAFLWPVSNQDEAKRVSPSGSSQHRFLNWVMLLFRLLGYA